jgi:hypothetical protein
LTVFASPKPSVIPQFSYNVGGWKAGAALRFVGGKTVTSV